MHKNHSHISIVYDGYGTQTILCTNSYFSLSCVKLKLNLPVALFQNESVINGYLYAFLLAFTSLGAAMANCHFTLLMNELGIKIRAAITTAVYKKTVGVSSSGLNRYAVDDGFLKIFPYIH